MSQCISAESVSFLLLSAASVVLRNTFNTESMLSPVIFSKKVLQGLFLTGKSLVNTWLVLTHV